MLNCFEYSRTYLYNSSQVLTAHLELPRHVVPAELKVGDGIESDKIFGSQEEEGVRPSTRPSGDTERKVESNEDEDGSDEDEDSPALQEETRKSSRLRLVEKKLKEQRLKEQVTKKSQPPGASSTGSQFKKRKSSSKGASSETKHAPPSSKKKLRRIKSASSSNGDASSSNGDSVSDSESESDPSRGASSVKRKIKTASSFNGDSVSDSESKLALTSTKGWSSSMSVFGIGSAHILQVGAQSSVDACIDAHLGSRSTSSVDRIHFEPSQFHLALFNRGRLEFLGSFNGVFH